MTKASERAAFEASAAAERAAATEEARAAAAEVVALEKQARMLER
jgi:hypothetical protein